MNKILIFSAAFLLHLCTCSDGAGQTTHIQGSLPAGSMAEYITVQYWLDDNGTDLAAKTDTITVIDGRYEDEIPNCSTEFGFVNNYNLCFKKPLRVLSPIICLALL